MRQLLDDSETATTLAAAANHFVGTPDVQDKPVVLEVTPPPLEGASRHHHLKSIRSQGGGRRVAPAAAAAAVAVEAAAADEEAEIEGERRAASVVEKALPNGDVYTGGFSRDAPHGRGKYLWTDGCMHEGEWRRGKAAGRGKFSWPSGATYEGEFRSGRMEGFGSFTGADGDTYRGYWSADLKHGYGNKCYANGDCYEGSWRRNLQEGHGRYVWRNGNQYIGEWIAGVISGRGVLIWANGDRYDGQWENGVPRGSGIFTWADGSCYVSSWSNGDPKSLNGTFYPSATHSRKERVAAGSGAGKMSPFSPLDDFLLLPPLAPPARKRSSVDGGMAVRGSSVAEKGLPKICIWESDGEAGDITCDIIDALEASMLYRNGSLVVDRGCSTFFRTEQSQNSQCCLRTEEAKKPGHTISKGHKNYDLMLNLQLGIRYSIGKPGFAQLRDLRPGDFDPKEKYWTRFPPEGSKSTPPHQSTEFRWKDYCPMVFRHLRKLFSVDPADYMLAICGNDALREFSSPGKSGSFFYMTQDDRFMIKTVKKSEVKVLIRMLSSYFQHVCRYENSLVTRFYGVHCVKPIGGQKVRFIVMGNLFCSEYRIHRRYDLKGSSYGRTTDKSEEEIDETTTLKDLDLNFVFRIQRPWYLELLKQINRDCDFLEAEGIMDYSLLVGFHFCDEISASKMGLLPYCASPVCGKKESLQGEGRMSDSGFSQSASQDKKLGNSLIRLGANMPARVEHVARTEFELLLPPGGGFSTPTRSSELHDVILYLGIIDILQDYDITKKLEHAYKSLQVDPNSISAVDPKLYSRRFQDFISRIFVED